MQFFLVYFSLCQGESEDGYFYFTHTHATNPPGTIYLHFLLFLFSFLNMCVLTTCVVSLHEGNGAHSKRLFLCAADRRLKMTVNEGLIPLGTLQNPIPSTEISSFQLSYLSYLFIFSQPGLTPPLFLSFPRLIPLPQLLALYINLFFFSVSPLATREPVSHFDWQHSSGLRKSASFFFRLSLFSGQASCWWYRGLIRKPNLLLFFWGVATQADWQLSDFLVAVQAFL